MRWRANPLNFLLFSFFFFSFFFFFLFWLSCVQCCFGEANERVDWVRLVSGASTRTSPARSCSTSVWPCFSSTSSSSPTASPPAATTTAISTIKRAPARRWRCCCTTCCWRRWRGCWWRRWRCTGPSSLSSPSTRSATCSSAALLAGVS